MLYICAVKGLILCPKCREAGRKPKVLGKHEDVVAQQGYVELWCKACKKPIRIELRDISLDR